jgi:hypothetical protein
MHDDEEDQKGHCKGDNQGGLEGLRLTEAFKFTLYNFWIFKTRFYTSFLVFFLFLLVIFLFLFCSFFFV